MDAVNNLEAKRTTMIKNVSIQGAMVKTRMDSCFYSGSQNILKGGSIKSNEVKLLADRIEEECSSQFIRDVTITNTPKTGQALTYLLMSYGYKVPAKYSKDASYHPEALASLGFNVN